MADNFKYVQAQFFTLAGAGCTLGATSITLSSFKQIDGTTNLTMTDFGTRAYGTLEPGNGVFEEQISFTGVVQNANGTATLTGVSTVLFVSPYTETSGTSMSHAGGVKFVISNTAGFYNQLTSKNDDETITGTYTFTNPNYPRMDTATPPPTANEQLATKKYVDDTAFNGAPDASTTIKGIVQLPTQVQVDAKTTTGSTGALLALTPDKQRSTLLSDYVIDTGAVNAYVITPIPAATAYTTGQIFSFKAINANTTASTLNVSGLGTKTIKKNGGASDLVSGDIVVGQIVTVEYDGTNLQLISPTAEVKLGQSGKEIYAADAVGTDAYAVTLVPAIAAYSIGLVVNFKAGTANTGAATLAVNGLGATTIKKLGGQSDLATGDIVVGQVITVVYDGTNFQMQSQTAITNAYAFGTASMGPVITAGNNDIAAVTGFTPRLIRLHYFIQGYENGTTTYKGQKGIAIYSGTTLTALMGIWGDPNSSNPAGASMSGDNGTIGTVAGTMFGNEVSFTGAPSAGRTTASSILTTLTIPAVSATGFTIRPATTIGTSTINGNARAAFYWEAWA